MVNEIILMHPLYLTAGIWWEHNLRYNHVTFSSIGQCRMRGLGRGRWSPFSRWGRNDRKIGWLVTMTHINVVSPNIGTVRYFWLYTACIFLYVIVPFIWMVFRSHCLSSIFSILNWPVDKKSPLLLSPYGLYFDFLVALFSLLHVLQYQTEHSVSGWSFGHSLLNFGCDPLFGILNWSFCLTNRLYLLLFCVSQFWIPVSFPESFIFYCIPCFHVNCFFLGAGGVGGGHGQCAC